MPTTDQSSQPPPNNKNDRSSYRPDDGFLGYSGINGGLVVLATLVTNLQFDDRVRHVLHHMHLSPELAEAAAIGVVTALTWNVTAQALHRLEQFNVNRARDRLEQTLASEKNSGR
jgi:hypothetical protein